MLDSDGNRKGKLLMACVTVSVIVIMVCVSNFCPGKSCIFHPQEGKKDQQFSPHKT